jgi:hypothetical protein
MSNASYPDKRKMCHRTGFTKSCRDLLDEGTCQGRWVRVTGVDLNDAGPEPKAFDLHGCVDDMQYRIQQSFEYRLVAVQAAVESNRNETCKLLAQERQHAEALRIGEALAESPARQLQYFESKEPQQLELLG